MNDIFNVILNIRKNQFEEIKREWGFSTIKLKKYLNGDPSTQHIYGFCEKSSDNKIDINVILPYTTKPIYYGRYAMMRLKYAIEAKAVIMFENGYLTGLEDETLIIYIKESLHLFLRVDSLQFKNLLVNYKPNEENHEYLWFSDTVIDTFNRIKNEYNERNNNDGWKNEIKFLEDKTEYFKPKRKQTLYHYQFEDFEMIRNFKNFKEAHKYWIENVWPTLLDNYKEKKLNEYKESIKKWNVYVKNENIHYENFNGYDFDEYQTLIDDYKKDLDLIKIKPLSYNRFYKTIQKLVKERYD